MSAPRTVPSVMSNRNSGSPSSRRRNIPSSLAPPRSPNFIRNRHSFKSAIMESGRPSSPTIRMNMEIENVPSIATTSIISTPPASPSGPTRTFQLPEVTNPTQKRMHLNLASKSSAIATTIPPFLSISCVAGDQPVVHQAKPTSKGGKRKMAPGCGLLDWIRLSRKNKDLAGTGGVKKPITPEELAKHCTEEDAWTAIRGKVYNITPYLKFHPGGKEDLMKGAGKDCTILFDEVHKWVNVDSSLKSCYIGALNASSPYVGKNSDLAVAAPVMITEGVNKQAVPCAIRKSRSTELRAETQAATVSEEPDGGLKQVSPESPIKRIRKAIGGSNLQKSSVANLEVAKGSSMRLSPPPTRHRRTSEPHPRFSWVQSEKAVIIHILTQNLALKTSDVVLDINGLCFEAAIFVGDWVFELDIALAHAIVTSQVTINCNRVEISLKKEVPHQQWETIGTFLEGHSRLSPKSRRGTKYHETLVENVRAVTHDTKLFVLRLPAGSYLNVPTGHHLSIKADIQGEEVERSYTPVSAMETTPSLKEQQEGKVIELMIKLYKDGKMSGFLSNLKQGDKVMVSDPDGTFDAQARLGRASNILLIAAGSGFTPMVKVLCDFTSTELVSRPQRNVSISEASSSEATGEASAENQQAPELPPVTNKTCECNDMVSSGLPKTAKLLFANKKERDVMYMNELEHLSYATAERFTVMHILSDAEKSWGGTRGRIGETLIRRNLPVVNPENSQEALVCICGPEPFTTAVTNVLVDLDYPDECIHVFE